MTVARQRLLLLAAVAALGAVIIARPTFIAPSEVALLPFHRSELDFYVLDDVAGHLHKPDVVRRSPWPEHPRGEVVARTNNLGLREDQPTTTAKPAGAVRILVVGDSHVDGVVDNHESFPNLLERSLTAADAGRGRRYEVLNGGTGHYGFHNYRGFLQRFRSLEPDVYVVVIYTGNDYLGAVRHLVAEGELELPPRPDGYLETMQAAEERFRAGPVAQVLNQSFFFHGYPAVKEVALAEARRELGAIQSLCSDDGVRLIVVGLPTKLDVDPPATAPVGAILESLGIDEAELFVHRELTATLARWMAAAGIEFLDLRPEFAATAEELYWREDYHLGLAGHARLAAVFEDRFGDSLRRPPAPP